MEEAALLEMDLGEITVSANKTANTSGLKLNIYGEGETSGFMDIAVNPRFSNGRPLSSEFPSGSAGNIVINNSPLFKAELDEITRLSKPGTIVSYTAPAEGGFFEQLSSHFSGTAEFLGEESFMLNEETQMKTVNYKIK